jgi:hypothetical protein
MLCVALAALFGFGCESSTPPPVVPGEDGPHDSVPAPNEPHNVVTASGAGELAVHNETDTDGVQWLVLTTAAGTTRFPFGGYPVSFTPDGAQLLVVAGDSGLISGLEALNLADPEGQRRRLTNIERLEGPGPLPRDFVPPPIDSGEWLSENTFQWTAPGDGLFQVNIDTGLVERVAD